MTEAMNQTIQEYNNELSESDRAVCERLKEIIENSLPEAESKVWHRHPVWFLQGNPIVGYSKLKNDVMLLFWSGQSFDEPGLEPEGSFKAAQARYTTVQDIDANALEKWLEKAKTIQWDYKNIVKRKGKLERIKVA